jgi:pyruvate dehydrogenase E1 component beta subunit
MSAAIEDDNPVIFMMHKALQGLGWLGTVQESIVPVPVEDYTVPIGKAQLVRTGSDITLVGLGATLHMALAAAKQLSDMSIDAEVLDLRSIVPMDREAILASVAKTGRLIVVDDDYSNCGIAAEIIATVVEHDMSLLKAAPKRIAYPDIPVPFSPIMEHYALPNAEKIMVAASEMLGLDKVT